MKYFLREKYPEELDRANPNFKNVRKLRSADIHFSCTKPISY